MTDLSLPSTFPMDDSTVSERDRRAHDADIEASRAVERRLVWKEAVAALTVVAVLVVRWLWAG